ncbi:MAG: dihydroorotate dehydrogenase electron transfer subunit [Pirellulales bacterium]|nr:dihydroorotate dehydrogenase electron transfer subunit [Pirellulales bacterium]
MSPGSCLAGPGDLAASYYADEAIKRRVPVVENIPLARDTWRLRLACPEIARRIVPGQFLMLRLPAGNDPLLGRPLALFDTVLDAAGTPIGVDVAYLVVGKMTARLATLRPGDELAVWGPLGNGFSPAPVDHLVMAAGGIGQTPFLALGREFVGGRRYGEPSERPVTAARRVTLCYGVRTAAYAAGVDDFLAAGVAVRLASNDGSLGRLGFVTAELEAVLDEAAAAGESVRIACCGPEPMMEAVAELAITRGVPCEVSLETPMACGIGACFSCVVKVRQPEGDWDYKRTCVEGPIFDAARIEWR